VVRQEEDSKKRGGNDNFDSQLEVYVHHKATIANIRRKKWEGGGLGTTEDRVKVGKV